MSELTHKEPWKAHALQPRKFYRNENCSSACTFGSNRLPGDMVNIVHGWFELGDNNDTIILKAAKVGVKLTNGSAGRHRKNHLTPVDQLEPDPTNQKLAKVNHIELLEQIVSRGASNVNVARISPDMALKAIEMIYKLNAGSQLSEFMQSVTDAMTGVDEDDGDYMTAVEAADAGRARDEVEQGEAVVE